MRPSFRLGWVAGAVAMAALGTAAFVATQGLLSSPKPGKSSPLTQGLLPKPPSLHGVPMISPPKSNSQDAPLGPQDTPGAEVAVYDLPHNVRREKTTLGEAIAAVAKECGMQVEIGPGIEDASIRLEYYGMTGLAMLKDLGAQYGFTAFDEGDGHVLVIPAQDPKTGPAPDAVPAKVKDGASVSTAEPAKSGGSDSGH